VILQHGNITAEETKDMRMIVLYVEYSLMKKLSINHSKATAIGKQTI